MADADDRTRILDMVAEGKITAADAASLLAALGGPGRPGTAPAPPRPPRTGSARTFRVSIDAHDGDEGDKKARIRVNIPLGLARFASRFLPPEAKAQLDAQGIDLVALLDDLGDDVPDGPLVDIDVDEPDTGKTAKIIVEVV